MDKIGHNKSNFMYVKTFSSDLEGRFTRKWDFTWTVSDCEELVPPSEEVFRQKLD